MEGPIIVSGRSRLPAAHAQSPGPPLWMPSRCMMPASWVVADSYVASTGSRAVILWETQVQTFRIHCVPQACLPLVLVEERSQRVEPWAAVLSPLPWGLCAELPFTLCRCLGNWSGEETASFPYSGRQILLTMCFPLAGSTRRRRHWRSLTRPTWGWQVGGPPRAVRGSRFSSWCRVCL